MSFLVPSVWNTIREEHTTTYEDVICYEGKFFTERTTQKSRVNLLLEVQVMLRRHKQKQQLERAWNYGGRRKAAKFHLAHLAQITYSMHVLLLHSQ